MEMGTDCRSLELFPLTGAVGHWSPLFLPPGLYKLSSSLPHRRSTTAAEVPQTQKHHNRPRSKASSQHCRPISGTCYRQPTLGPKGRSGGIGGGGGGVLRLQKFSRQETDLQKCSAANTGYSSRRIFYRERLKRRAWSYKMGLGAGHFSQAMKSDADSPAGF